MPQQQQQDHSQKASKTKNHSACLTKADYKSNSVICISMLFTHNLVSGIWRTLNFWHTVFVIASFWGNLKMKLNRKCSFVKKAWDQIF